MKSKGRDAALRVEDRLRLFQMDGSVNTGQHHPIHSAEQRVDAVDDLNTLLSQLGRVLVNPITAERQIGTGWETGHDLDLT